MKKLLAMAMLATAAVNTHAIENQPDSLYLFSYTTDHNKNHDGLHFAWSIDNKSWHKIGDSHNFVSSDYGPWGRTEKDDSTLCFYAVRTANGCAHGL